MMLVPYPLYPTVMTITQFLTVTGTDKDKWVTVFRSKEEKNTHTHTIWRTAPGRRGSKHVNGEIFKCKMCQCQSFGFSCFQKRDCRQIKWIPQTSVHSFCTAPSPRWQVSQNNSLKDFKIKTLLVHRMSSHCLRQNKTSLYTAKHTT